MSKKIKYVAFNNKTLPKAQFDILPLEELFSRKFEDHSPEKLHRVGFYMIMIVTENTGLHTIDFEECPCKPGTILTIRQDQIHKFHFSQAKGFLLLFTDDFLVSYLEKLQTLKSLQLFNELLGGQNLQLPPKQFEEICFLIKEIQEEYLQKQDDYSLGIIRSFLHILITKLYRFKAKEGKIVKEVKYLKAFLSFQQLVEKECFQTKKVLDYAHKLGCSSKTLNNVVQSVLGKTAKTFIDEIVIMQIKRLLINSSLSIQEIAYTAGFEEPTNLFKYFKKYVQLSPQAFRQKHQ